MRHMGVVRLMRDIIRRGDIGEPKTVWVRHFVGYGGDYYFKDWHADRTRTTGLLLQKAAHDLDVVHWLAGGYTTLGQRLRRPHGVRRAAAQGARHAPPRRLAA
ncbi:Gfo/Idh/MocA family oxidoreductase [Nonomuraea ferruginea]